jgi:hypothetical protein
MSRRTWIATASAVGALLWLWLFLHPRERPDFSDFHVYWIAGNNARLHLTAHAVEGHYQFKYSPFVALLWAPPTFWGNEFFWSVLRATTRAVYDGRGFWIGAAWGLALQWKLYALPARTALADAPSRRRVLRCGRRHAAHAGRRCSRWPTVGRSPSRRTCAG